MLENTDVPYITSPDSDSEEDEYDDEDDKGRERKWQKVNNDNEELLRSDEKKRYDKYVRARLDSQDAAILARLQNSKTLQEPEILLDLDSNSIAKFLKRYRSYKRKNGLRQMSDFINKTLYAPLRIRCGFDDTYFGNLSTMPNENLEGYLTQYAYARDVNEFIKRLQEVKCYIKSIDRVTPVELANYYTNFVNIIKDLGPNKPREKKIIEIWINNLKPSYFQQMINDAMTDDMSLQRIFELALDFADTSEIVADQVAYLRPTLTSSENKNQTKQRNYSNNTSNNNTTSNHGEFRQSQSPNKNYNNNNNKKNYSNSNASPNANQNNFTNNSQSNSGSNNYTNSNNNSNSNNKKKY